MFTFSFSTAFAFTAPTSATADASAKAFSKYVANELKTVMQYDGAGNVVGNADVSHLDKDVVESVAATVEQEYLNAIYAETANFDNVWYGAGAGKFDADTDFITYLITARLADLNEAQADKLVAAGTAAIATVDLSLYSTANQTTLAGYIDDIVSAISTVSTTTNKANIETLESAINTLTTAVATMDTVTSTATDVEKAKAAAIKNLNEKAEAFIDNAKDYFADNAASLTVLKKIEQASLESDVAKVQDYFLSQIEDCAIGGYNDNGTKYTTYSQITTVLSGLNTAVNSAFATAGYAADGTENFYTYLNTLETLDIVFAALEKDAAAKEALRSADGRLVYEAADVARALDVAKAAASREVYRYFIQYGDGNIANAPTVITVADNAYVLADYKASAISAITSGDYALANFSGSRATKVGGIQDDYTAKILVAESVADVDALAKEAKTAIGAVLTTSEISTLTSRTQTRYNIKGFDDTTLERYFAVVIGSAATGYPTTTRDDAVDAAQKVLVDAVIATEDADLTYAEIDAIIAANKEAAFAALADVKTTTELKAIGVTVKDEIAKIPATVTLADKEVVLAAQKAMDNYMDLAGATKAYVGNVGKLTSAMTTLMSLEAKAVNDAIRALPATITVADAEKVNAARAAYKALATTYGAYDNGGAADYENYLGASIQSLVTRYTTLTTAETALESAKVADAAKQIEALTAASDIAAVEAAKAAYEGLKVRSKLAFDGDLYAKLVSIEKTVTDATAKAEEAAKAEIIASVEGLKIKANSSAKKGSITVKWTVTGDASNVEKYQVYKSTKAQTGYKKSITTTKTSFKNTKNLKAGTRYYYKVRAFVTVDGVKYYSDWSNKANRVAK